MFLWYMEIIGRIPHHTDKFWHITRLALNHYSRHSDESFQQLHNETETVEQVATNI